MNEIINMPLQREAGLVAASADRYSISEIRQRVNLIQEVLRNIMKEGTHYGVIPGTPKPTLYKAGAEQLCVTFRIAPEYRIEDLSTSDVARYRITCIGRHQTTGIVLGEGIGECSSNEEKYKWRAAVCAEEFDLTPEHMRRIKFGKQKGGGHYKANQVRTEPADLANTVLKMAGKRAFTAMTLNVTAASDIFTQDIEDLPEELRGSNDDVGQPAMTELALKWVKTANEAKTKEELEAIWKNGVKEINTAKDVVASNAFKEAVTAKGATFKAAEGQKPVGDPQKYVPVQIPAELEGLVADLEAGADEGIEPFLNMWERLSEATRAQINAIPNVYANLKARAEKAEGSK